MANREAAHEAYVVVLDPACLGSLYGDTSKVIVRPDNSVSYRGIDRDPWWNLDELFYEGLLDAKLTALRQTIEASALDGFSCGVCDSLYVAQRVQALSATRPLKDEIIRIVSAFDPVDQGAGFLGYDCYVDGFGSPLRLGVFGATTAFADYEDRLNEYGLLSSLDDLRAYVSVYCQRCEQARVEVIETHRISSACFFQVWGLSEPAVAD
jgi:hypothetical protein